MNSAQQQKKICIVKNNKLRHKLLRLTDNKQNLTRHSHDKIATEVAPGHHI